MKTQKKDMLNCKTENDELETMGCRIRYLREQKKLSIIELADLAHITPDYLGKIERGSKTPRIQIIKLLVKALDSNYDYILDGTVIDYGSLFKFKSCSIKNKLFITNLVNFVLSQLEK